MRTLVVSHRANAGNDAGAGPEHTLAGIDAAVRAGAHAIEIDVRATRDGALVLLHDATLWRTAGDPRAVADLTLAELREVRVRDPHGRLAPQPVPTLDEAIQAIAGRCAIEIDFPETGIEPDVATLVRRMGAERWTWFTTHPPEAAALLRHHCPRSTVLLSVHAQPRRVRDVPDAVRIAGSLGLHGINPPHRVLSAALVDHAHVRGLLVGCWTANEPADLARAAGLGVDHLTTDYPARAFQAIRGHRRWPGLPN